jgi:hypothetical protein
MEQQTKLGALWQKDGFLTGQLEPTEELITILQALLVTGGKLSIVAFKNKYKEQEKHPDYQILVSKPKQDRQPEEIITPF